MKITKSENIFVLSLSMGIIAALAAGILAFFDKITEKPRRDADLRVTVEALQKLQPKLNNNPDQEKIFVVKENGKWSILPKGESPAKYGLNVVTFFPAEENGKLISVIGQTVSPKGYGGNMTLMLAMKPNGTIENVIVTKNNETPGLGTVVTDRVRQKTIWGLFGGEKIDPASLPPNKILDQFDGLVYIPPGATPKKKEQIPDSQWKVKKDGGDMIFLTGATISSRAVTYGVKKIVEVYSDAQKEILDAFKPKTQPAKN